MGQESKRNLLPSYSLNSSDNDILAPGTADTQNNFFLEMCQKLRKIINVPFLQHKHISTRLRSKGSGSRVIGQSRH